MSENTGFPEPEPEPEPQPEPEPEVEIWELYPLVVNFNNKILYPFYNDNNDDIEWQIFKGPTETIGTGPSGDYPTGEFYYAYAESSSPNHPSKKANLIGRFKCDYPVSFEFFYHMFSSDNDPENISFMS